ncbi:hypothetical protein [Yinghuangia seranimata]|uniref:hypothetical protein n=1 Tax=Yinghuangia seranimata TaxID=408067 RepID=UPI00248B6290|nr:hypothetical protein [Yinghuangia seranimata]MDI2126371.1 hypothetical protein [Yinghuangia seranimata]
MEGSERTHWNGDVRSAVRVYGGWLVALVGAILCAVGWYGVSGEKYEARQIPYLASATVPGAALIVAGAVLIAARLRGRDGDGPSDTALRAQMAELHALLVEPVPDAPALADEPVATDTARPWVALPRGARYHRADCDLVHGKAGVHAVTRDEAAEQDLRACALCDPDDPDDAGAEGERPAGKGTPPQPTYAPRVPTTPPEGPGAPAAPDAPTAPGPDSAATSPGSEPGSAAPGSSDGPTPPGAAR